MYVLYIHPFELSAQDAPPSPTGTPWATYMRFRTGRRSTPQKLRKLISILKANGFRFTTFAALRAELLSSTNEVDNDG
jgi:hypothetical protein